MYCLVISVCYWPARFCFANLVDTLTTCFRFATTQDKILDMMDTNTNKNELLNIRARYHLCSATQRTSLYGVIFESMSAAPIGIRMDDYV